MDKRLIPDKINRFNAYVGTVDAANKIVGISNEIQLPTFEGLTETIFFSGSGGEVESPAVGLYKSCDVEIPFTNISPEGMKLAGDDSLALILRGAQEYIDPETNAKSFKNRTITIMGMTKKIDYGKLKMGGNGEPSITKEVTMYKDVLDGEIITEIHKFGGGKTIVNGIDVSAQIEDLI